MLMFTMVFAIACGNEFEEESSETQLVDVETEQYIEESGFTVQNIEMSGTLPLVGEVQEINSVNFGETEARAYSHRVAFYGTNESGAYMGMVALKNLNTEPEIVWVRGCSGFTTAWDYDSTMPPSSDSTINYNSNGDLVVQFKADLSGSNQMSGFFLLERQ